MPHWVAVTIAIAISAMCAIVGFVGTLFPRQTFRFLATLGQSRKTPGWALEIEKLLGSWVRYRLTMLAILVIGAILAGFELEGFSLWLNLPQDLADEVAAQRAGLLGWGSLVSLAAGVYLARVPQHYLRWCVKRRMSRFPSESPEQQKAEELKLAFFSRIMGLLFLCIATFGFWVYLLVNGLLSF